MNIKRQYINFIYQERKKERNSSMHTDSRKSNKWRVRPGIVMSTSTMNGTAASNLNSILRIRSHQGTDNVSLHHYSYFQYQPAT
jgi:hypothetical protein